MTSPNSRSARYIQRKLHDSQKDIDTPSQTPKTKRKHTKRISLVYHKKNGDLLILELTKDKRLFQNLPYFKSIRFL